MPLESKYNPGPKTQVTFIEAPKVYFMCLWVHLSIRVKCATYIYLFILSVGAYIIYFQGQIEAASSTYTQYLLITKQKQDFRNFCKFIRKNCSEEHPKNQHVLGPPQQYICKAWSRWIEQRQSCLSSAGSSFHLMARFSFTLICVAVIAS